MSAFVVLYDFRGVPVDSVALGRAMKRLAHRGPDGQNTFLGGHVAIGHWHFWTTPEEVGESQPLRIDGLPFTLVFDGRLDNRADLLARLSIDSQEGALLSDAALVLRAYASWGERCVDHFLGEFALVLYDERAHSLFCARDQLGDRVLFYAHWGNLFVLASEPWAVLGALGMVPELDEAAVSLYFGHSLFDDGLTFFCDVFELLPAHTLTVTPSGHRLFLYWQADLEKKIRYKTDHEYSEHLLSLLEESVRCRLRAVTPVGVQMSGGLDSTTLACLVARQVAPERLVTISNVFEELQGCDETPYIDAIQQKWSTVSIKIPSDHDWPYKNWTDWPHIPNAPVDFPYRLLIAKIYAEANARGLRVLFTGDFGDHLYRAESHWLADYLFDFKLAGALRESAWHLGQKDFHLRLMFRYLLPFASRLFGLSGIKKQLRSTFRPPDWLTPSASAYLQRYDKTAGHPYVHLGSILSHKVARFSSGETLYASPYKLEIRTPYRDRRLVEFCIALPAYQIYRRRAFKFVTREAMKDILPESVRTKHKATTSFLPLYFRGIERERAWLESVFQVQPSSWENYVRRDWMDAHWRCSEPVEEPVSSITVLWSCMVFESWYRKVFYAN